MRTDRRHRLRRTLSIATAAVSALVLAGCSADSSAVATLSTSLAPPSTAQARTTISDDQLRAIATGAASRLGENDPTRIEAVLTTRSAANGLVGAEGFDDTAAYMIQAHGTFSTAWQHRPSGVDLPPTVTGVLMLIVDAQTGEGMDSGTSGEPADLTKLGKVITLDG
ncbi:hypothetical protein [Rhodococcus sp. W8901]|uniref:hypothetical protein n=1 Tax=Rhodococcus sp. W8901 TaxID=2742603 RepID=UPI001582FBF6|nr:hypothetical protein [Rhodococcus sp. W8901]QKT13659.1 hypothetical protein HUN07_25520 [Rhodococcus sp. W8901]